ncbi:MAG: tetratricopeptide repeat protein, partial [Methyloprofundus sp.]|nr:tetratricopeptide repeat protein [Methyloprofundus sp.]
MKIKKVCLIVLAGLQTACSLTAKDKEEEKFQYVVAEKVELDRPTEDRAQTLTDLGLAYYQLGKYVYALEYLQRSLALDEKNAVTYQVIALINERSNKPKQTQLYFDKALKLAPDNFDIVTSYAVFLYQQDRYKEALIEFNR